MSRGDIYLSLQHNDACKFQLHEKTHNDSDILIPTSSRTALIQWAMSEATFSKISPRAPGDGVDLDEGSTNVQRSTFNVQHV